MLEFQNYRIFRLFSQRVNNLIFLFLNHMIMNYSRIAGAIYGAAVGDAIGATFEGKRSDNSRTAEMVGGGKFSLNPGEVTDDTYMMLALFETWRDAHSFDSGIFLQKVILTIREHPVTFGRTTGTLAKLLEMGCNPELSVKIIDSLYGSRTNGSVMRTLPIGLVFPSLEEVKITAEKVSKYTHYAPEAALACSVVSESIFRLYHGMTKEKMLKFIPVIFQEGDCIPSVDAIESTRCAYYLFSKAESYPELITEACRLGGDSDTIAAIAGGMWGAAYGIDTIPKEWINALEIKKRIENLLSDLAGNCQITGMSHSC